MKKYIYITLVFTAFFLQGCDKGDIPIGAGKGKMLRNGRVYQFHTAYIQTIPERGGTYDPVTNDPMPFYSYFHALILEGTGGTGIDIVVRSLSDKLESGEFHMQFQNQWRIILTDDFIHFNTHFNPGTKMKLSITEKDDIFEVELRYAECVGDFLIKYRGLVKDWW
jgi:hypothetical protein